MKALTLALLAFVASVEAASSLTLSGPVTNLSADLYKQLNDAVAGNVDPATVLAELKNIKTNNRWIGATRRKVVIAYCFYYDPPANKFVVTSFDEKERNTLFADQFNKLLTVAKSVGGVAAATKPVRVNSTKYELQQKRATLTITAKVQDKAADTPEALGDPTWFVVLDLTDGAHASDNKDNDTITLSTGPREPWSISADLPVNHVSELKINDQTHTIENKEQPGLFYAGFDYAPWGDVLGPASAVTDAFVIKFLGKVSKKPTDSFGVGLAFRPGFYSHILPTLQIFDTFSPFAAVTWTRQDEQLASGQLKANVARKRDFRVGLSFNIDKAVDWTKSNDNSKKQ